MMYFLKGVVEGGWHSSAEWNDRLADFKFVGAEAYLRSIWEGKP
jgi:hypothetical protein